METENNTQREAVGTNWDALKTDFSGDIMVEEKPTQTETTTDTTTESKSEEKPEETTEKATETTETKSEEKTTETAETTETTKAEEENPVTLDVTDIKGFEKEPEDGTWLATAKFTGLEIQEDTPEAFKAAIESKIETVKKEAEAINRETVFSTLDPKVATALKLIEAGYPQETALNPTKPFDELLAMDDTSIIRAALELQKWDADKIDLELETLSEKPERLKHEAWKIRQEASQLKENTINQQAEILKQYEENKSKVAVQQQEQDRANFRKALDSKSEFMGGQLTTEAKSVIDKKYAQGEYNSILKDPQSMVDFIYWKEFGNKIFESEKKKAYNEGLLEQTKKLLNVPPKQAEVAKKITAEKIKPVNQVDNNFKALEGDFS